MKTADGTILATNSRQYLFTTVHFVLILSLFVIGLFADVVSGTNSFFYRDFGLWAYPDAMYHRDCFWRGEVPLWNPYNNCGLPFLAQWNTITLYPLSLIYLLLPMPWALNIFCLSHLWLAGVGMYLLARRWTGNGFAAAIAGMAYGLNGLTLHSLMWPNNIAALAWLPFVLLLLERARESGGRWMVLAGAGGALQMLAGAPEIILLTWLIAGALAVVELARQRSLWRRVLGRFALVAGLVTLLCAVQLLPFFELINISQRSSSFGDSTWSMPSWGWANFFVPLFHQSKSLVGVYSQDEQQWTSSYYVGVGVILLTFFAIFRVSNYRARLLGVLGLFAIPLAMGEHTFLYPMLKVILPQLGFARFPIKFVVMSIIAFPLLAAFALGEFCSVSDRSRTSDRLLKGVWVVVSTIVLGLIWVSRSHLHVGENLQVTLLSAFSRWSILTLIFCALMFLRALPTSRTRLCAQWLVVLLFGVDAATHTARQNPTIPVEMLKPNPAVVSTMPGLGAGRAMVSQRTREFIDHAATTNLARYYLGYRATLFADCNLIDRVPKTDGFYSLYFGEEQRIRGLFRDSTTSGPEGLADFMGATRISSGTNIFTWTLRSTALPLITSGQEVKVADVAATLTALANPGFDGRKVVFVPEGTAPFSLTTNQSNAKIEVTRFSTHRIEATLDLASIGPVVISQTFAPGWRGYLDGSSVPILRANYAFQMISVPAGRHTLELHYSSRWFESGLILSALTAIVCAAAWRTLCPQHRGRRR